MSQKSETATISELLGRSTGFLKEKGSATPRLDSELLLAEVLSVNRIELYTNFDKPLNQAEIDAYRELIKRRGKGEPVAYILGRAYFRNLTLRITPSVLVPRPETEHVVDAAHGFLQEREWAARSPEVLDLGTGSGAVAVSIAAGFPGARITATDTSVEALDLARENARTAGVAMLVDFVQSDLFEDLDPTRTFDLIVSNPPYISADEWPSLPPDVREFEPREALYGGLDGLDIYRCLAVEAPQFLRPRGCLILEIGSTQGPAVMELLEDTGLYESVAIEKDYAGHDRVVIAMRRKI
ncbi:MAG: peptide chain release factor N(5)-glutamine methyltransferase [Thermoleophilia bacterium]|nr:peptide chain release factor N(5)-glutamine methyltransferase [Thermoleophilia bacterium]